MFCTKCGHSNNDNFKFCQKCGTPLSDVGVWQQSSSEKQQQSHSGQKQSLSGQQKQKTGKKNDKTALKLILIAVAVLVIICLTVLAVSVLGGNDEFDIVFEQQTEDSDEERASRKKDSEEPRDTKDDSAETKALETEETAETTEGLSAFTETQAQAEGALDRPVESEKVSAAESDDQAIGSYVQHNNVSVEDEVVNIREKYNTIVSNISSGKYNKVTLDHNIAAHYDGGELKAVIIPLGANGINYRQFYYYDQGQLIFAYFENDDSHRFYFCENQLIRWRYCYDAAKSSEAVNYDQENSNAYKDWETLVLDEAYAY